MKLFLHSTLHPQLSVQPNPFSNSTNIIFAIPQDERVSIVIYNVLGKEVKRILGMYTSDEHKIEWAGDDMQGNALGKGLYHVKMETGKHSVAVKVVLMK
ncbi:MAG: T9SS type A sorting domain-containing protein [Chitinophagales bacterium]|nr:T9SS type A sorting domain-containing protein [Chitinophagales bacterium]